MGKPLPECWGKPGEGRQYSNLGDELKESQADDLLTGMSKIFLSAAKFP